MDSSTAGQVHSMAEQVNSIAVQVHLMATQVNSIAGQMNSIAGQVNSLYRQEVLIIVLKNSIAGQVDSIVGQGRSIIRQVESIKNQVDSLHGQLGSISLQMNLAAGEEDFNVKELPIVQQLDVLVERVWSIVEQKFSIAEQMDSIGKKLHSTFEKMISTAQEIAQETVSTVQQMAQQIVLTAKQLHSGAEQITLTAKLFDSIAEKMRIKLADFIPNIILFFNSSDNIVIKVKPFDIRSFLKRFILQPYKNTVLHVIGYWKIVSTDEKITLRVYLENDMYQSSNFELNDFVTNPEMLLKALDFKKSFVFVLTDGIIKVCVPKYMSDCYVKSGCAQSKLDMNDFDLSKLLNNECIFIWIIEKVSRNN